MCVSVEADSNHHDFTCSTAKPGETCRGVLITANTLIRAVTVETQKYDGVRSFWKKKKHMLLTLNMGTFTSQNFNYVHLGKIRRKKEKCGAVDMPARIWSDCC